VHATLPATELEPRAWRYLRPPSAFGFGPCRCGNTNTDWSMFEGHLRCERCLEDFLPKHNGVFDSPIRFCTVHLTALSFDRVNLATSAVERFDLNRLVYLDEDGEPVKVPAIPTPELSELTAGYSPAVPTQEMPLRHCDVIKTWFAMQELSFKWQLANALSAEVKRVIAKASRRARIKGGPGPTNLQLEVAGKLRQTVRECVRKAGSSVIDAVNALAVFVAIRNCSICRAARAS
jgi:hypothetical protein